MLTLCDVAPECQDRLWVRFWALVKGFSFSCHNKETILFTIDPHSGNLNPEPLKEPFRLGIDPLKEPCYGNLKLIPQQEPRL